MKHNFRHRWNRIDEHDEPIDWAGLAGVIAAAGPFCVAGGLAIASGLGPLADVLLLLAGYIAAIRCGAAMIGFVLTFIPLAIPRNLLSGTLVTTVFLYSIWYNGNVNWLGSSALALIAVILGCMGGTSIYAVCRAWRRRTGMSALGKGLRTAYAALSTGLIVAAALWVADVIPFRPPAYAQHALNPDERNDVSLALIAEDPSTPGHYSYTTFTYGSGYDRQRRIFGSGADIVTPTVDASAIIDKLDWSRKWLWGYDASQLPLNGRVWMPEGEGKFPLVLIVHGNHSMADYSDAGYGYLGELLASRGFIAVSVDENIVNHSTWTGGIGSLDIDITLRAWLLLQHVAAIEQLSVEDHDNPFSGKVDMDRIAIIGHSRGGQAAVLAADYERFMDDEGLEAYRIDRRFRIQAVVAMAPTDFLIHGKRPAPVNVNYLLLQGSGDADINTYAGDRQYNRVRFSGDASVFKASLYIRGANHGQFNTDWNRADISLPSQLLLNKKDLLSGEEQRRIAKVYISAFLESVFHHRTEYAAMFEDYRAALDWLPQTQYVNRYQEAGFRTIANYEEDRTKESARFGVTIRAEGVQEWIEEDLKNRKNLSQLNRVMKLTWEQSEAEYILELPHSSLPLDDQSSLAFDLAELPVAEGNGLSDDPLSATVIVTDADGDKAAIDLADAQPIPQPIETKFLKSHWLEPVVRKGGLRTSAEPVLQSYRIPLTAFVHRNPLLDLSRLAEIRFRFAKPSAGRIMLDEVGFYRSWRFR